MKKYVKLLILILLNQIAIAQNKTTFGIRAGANLSQVKLTGPAVIQELKDGLKPLVSYSFGVYTNIPFSKSFSFQPGLSLVGKGTNLDINRNDNLITDFGVFAYNQIYKRQLNVAYLEAPLNVVFTYKNFFVGAGPYFAYALFGTDKETDVITLNTGAKVRDNNPPQRDIVIGNSDNADIRPWDIGANTTIGYQLKNGLNFSANYALNLAKTDLKSGTDVVQMSNRVLTFLVGFAF